jgi:hypothetical protein
MRKNLIKKLNMKKMYVFVIFNLVLANLLSQNPCDARLFDDVRASVGENATYVYGMTSTENGKRLGYGAFTMCLNEGILYRFTAGNSKLSEVDETISLFFGDDKNPLLQKTVKAGEILNFEFNCTKSGKYKIRLSYKKPGKSCSSIILSKVTK